MAKDRFWFEHDSNAHANPKVKHLRMKHGWAAYGAFWAIVEMLRDSEGYMIDAALLDAICFDLRIEKEWVDTMFNKGLLETDGASFWSNTLVERMTKWDESKRRRSAAGRKGGNAKAKLWHCHSKATAMPEQCSSTDKATLKQCSSGALASTEQNRTEQNRQYIYKQEGRNSEVEQDKNSQSKRSSDKTSKVDLQPLDEAVSFLPKQADQELARQIVKTWPDCLPADAVAWVQQGKQYLLQLDGDPIEWLKNVSTSRSPNDLIYVQGRNKLHQWLMNCLKNTIKAQAAKKENRPISKAGRVYQKSMDFLAQEMEKIDAEKDRQRDNY